MAGKNVTKEIKKQLIAAPAEVVKNIPFTKLLDNASEKPTGKEASPVYKGKTVLPLKKTENGTTKIDASPKEIAEFVKTSSKIKGMVRDINFDTLNNDITKLNKRIMSMGGGWKSKTEMDDIVSSVKDMNDRIGAFEEYRKKYSDTNLSDLSELKTAYDGVLKELENNSSVFANYSSAEEFEEENGVLKGLYSLSSKEIEDKMNDSVNSVYDTAKGYKNEIQRLRKVLEVEKKYPAPNTDGPSTQDLINKKEKELKDFLKKEGYRNFEELENANKGVAYTTADGYTIKWEELYNDALKSERTQEVKDSYDINKTGAYKKKDVKYTTQTATNIGSDGNYLGTYSIQSVDNEDAHFYNLVNGDKEAQDYENLMNVNVANTNDDTKYFYVTDEERLIFNTLWEEVSPQKAKEYIDLISPELRQRKIEHQEAYYSQMAKESPVGASFASVVANLGNNAMALPFMAADYIKNGQIDPDDPLYTNRRSVQTIRGTVENEVIDSTAGKFFYRSGMNIADNLAARAVSLGMGTGVASQFLMSSGAAVDTVLDAKNRGLSDEQALGLGVISGAAEAFFEGKAFEAWIDKKTLTKGAWQYFTNNIKTDLVGEVFTEGTNDITDVFIGQDLNKLNVEYQSYLADGLSEKEAFLKVVGGVASKYAELIASTILSAGVMSGPGAIIGGSYQSSLNKSAGKNIKINKTVGDVFSIITEADTPSAYDVLAQYKKKGINTDNITDAQLGKLYNNAMLDAQEVIESKKSTAEQKKTAEEIIAKLNIYAQNNNVRTAENADRVKLAREEASKKQSPLPQAIVEGNKTTEALYRDASLGNISLQLARMGYLESDLKDVAQTLVNYAKGKISIAEAERILSIPQADAIAQMIEQDVNLRELIADPKAQGVASDETLGSLVTKAKASKSEAELFRSEIDLFYAAGKNNISYAEVERMYSAKSLSSDERMAAYYRGLENAQRVYTLKNGKIVEMKMNGSVKGGLLVNDGARRLTNIQKRFLMKLGETLGKTITIQDNLRNSDGKRVSGFINDTAVFIDASVKDPIMWTATHEFSHQMQKLAPETWAKYRDYVINLKKKNGTYDEDLETYKKDYGNISETELQDEMACDYTDQLFKNEKDLLDFINHSKSLATKVKDMWFKILDWLNIPHKEDARSLWEKCYKEAAKKASKEARKGQSSTSGEVRYKMVHTPDGDSYWQIETEKDLFKGLKTVKELQRAAFNYILKGDKGNRITELIDGKELEFIRVSAEEYVYGEASKDLTSEEYKQKMRMSTSIIDLIENATIKYDAPDHKNHKLFPNGFKNYQGKVGIDETIFRYIVRVGKAKNGMIFYDINLEVDGRVPRANRTSPIKSSTSMNRVPHKKGSVKNYSMQNGGKNSPKERSRISSAAEATRKNRESDSEYEKTHETELAKENARLRKTIEDMHLQLAQNDGSGVNMDVVRDVVKSIKENYYSKVNAKGLQRELAGLYTYMQGRDVDGEEVNRRARAIAEKVVESAVIKNNELYNEYYELLDKIKNTRIKVSDYDKPGFKDGFEYYRKHYTMGKLRLTNDGMELDVFWDELSKEYPHLIDENMMGAEERLNRLLEIREDFQPVYESAWGEQTEEITNKLTEDIKETFYNVPEGTGEKKAVFYDTRSADIKKTMEKMQKQHDEAFRKLDEKYARLIKRAEAEKAKAEKQRDYYHNRLDKQKILPTIHRNYRYLSKMLLDPTDSRHIPQEMRPMVAEFLRMFKSEAVDSALLNEDKVLSVTATKKAQLYDAYTKIMNELTRDDGVIDESGKSLRIDSSLLAELEAMKNSIPIEENGQFISFADMNAFELNIVSKLLKGIHHAVTVQNNLFAAKSRRGVRESGEKLVKENKEIVEKKGRRKSLGDGKGKIVGTALDWIDEEWNYNELAPIDVFTRMGGVMEELYRAERKGFDKHIKNIKECIEKVQSIVEDTDANKWTGKNAKAEEFVTSAGKIKLTRAQVMSLYALSKRKQALNHMLYGGITSDDVKTNKNENLKTIEALHITKDDIQNIVATMSEDEKRVADAIVNFITMRGAELGNETSMKLYGYEKFGEQWYFPIKVAGEAVATFYGDRGEGSVRSQGFTKSLAKGAKNPIVITDFFDAAISHMSGMSLYNSVALPMLDMERVLNYSQYSLEEKNEIGDVITPSKFITTARSSLIEAYGEAAESYIAKLHKDINGQTKNSEGDTLFDNILSKSKKVSVGATLRVLLQQPTSISRAFMFLSPVDFAGAKAGKTTIEEMQNHSQIAYWKSLGFYDIEVGRSMKDIMLGNETALEKLAYGGYGKADDMTWGLIWSAVKNETKRLNPDMEVGSKEFFDKVTERFDYIIDRSQVVDSVFHRTQSMRSKNAFTKTETVFMSEPLKNLNLMRTELFIGQRNGTLKKTIPKVITVTVLNAAMVATMQSIVDLWRDDDDEWNKGSIKDKLIGLVEKLERIWTENFVDDLKMWNQVPYVKTFSSMFGKYGVSRFEYSLFEDFSYAIKGMANEKKPLSAKIQSLAKTSAALFGIPVPNMMRDIEGVIKNAYLLFGDDEYASYNLQKFKLDVSNPKNKGAFLKYYERAIENGNAKTAEMIITDYLMVMSDKPGSDNYIKNVINYLEKGKYSSIPKLTVYSIIPGVGTGGKKAAKDEHIEAQEEMLRLYKNNKKNNFMFSMPDQSFTVDGIDVVLTNEEYADMSISAHDKLMSMAFEFINSDGYDELTDEEKAAGMKEIESYAVDSSKKDVYDDFELSGWKQDVYDGYIDIGDRVIEKVEETKKKNIGIELYDSFRGGAEEFEDAIEDYIDEGYDREYLIKAAQYGASESNEYKKEVRSGKQEKYNLDGLTLEEKGKFTELKNELALYNAKTKYFPEYSANSWASKFYNDQILVNRGEEEHMKMLTKYDTYKVSIGKDGKTLKKAEIEAFVKSYTTDPILRRSIFRAIAPKNMKNNF